MAQRWVTREEVQRFVGQRVTLRLSPDAPDAGDVSGRLTSVLEAADGMVVFLEPALGPPDTRVSYHSHYIVGIAPMAEQGG